MRDDFSQATKDLLANRVGWRCSNPECRRPTRGAGVEKSIINVGVAAHITAASKNGPRYNKNMTSEERKSFENGIWLCQYCSKLIDSDVEKYTVEKLKEWKKISEKKAALELEKIIVCKDEEEVGLSKYTIEQFNESIDWETTYQDGKSEDKAIDEEDRFLKDMLIQALDAVKIGELDNGLKIAESALEKAHQNINSLGRQYLIANLQQTVAQIMLALHKDLDRALELINAAIKNSDFNNKPDKLCRALIIKAGIAVYLGDVKIAKGSLFAAEQLADNEATKTKVMYLKAKIMIECGDAFDAEVLLQDCLDYYSSQIASCMNEDHLLVLTVQYAEILNCIGFLYQQVGNCWDAIDCYKLAIDEVKDTRYLLEFTLFNLNYAECLFRMGGNENSKQCLNVLKSIEPKVENLSQRYLKKRFYELKYAVQHYFGYITESENSIKLALKYTKEAREKIYYHQILANYVMYDGDGSKMLSHLEEAKKLASDLDDKTLLCMLNEQENSIGKYANYKFRKEEDNIVLLTKLPSEDEFEEEINIKEIERLKTNEEKEMALSKWLREVIKNVREKDKKNNVSQDIINGLIKMAEEEKNPIKKAGIYNKIGHQYYMIGKLVEAKYWQELAYNKVKNTHSIQIKAYTLMGLADIALSTHKQHDEIKAKKYIEEVENIICGKPYWDIFARCELYKVEFEGRKGNYDAAYKCIKEIQKLIEEYKLQMDDEFNYALSCCSSFATDRLMKVTCHEEELESLNEERLFLERWYPKYRKQLRRYWWYYRGEDVIRNLKGSRKSIGILALDNSNAIEFFGEALSTLFSISSYVVKEDLSSIDNFSTYTLPVPENTPFPFSVSFIIEEETGKYTYTKNSDGTNKHYQYVMIKSDEVFDQELEPKPIALNYTGLDIPDIVYSIPIVTKWEEKSGLWWIASNFKNDDSFVKNVLNYAKELKGIPVFDYKTIDLSKEVEIIKSKRILIPYYDPLIKEYEFLEIKQVRSIMRKLTELTSVDEIQAVIDELLKQLEHLSITVKGGIFVDIVILSFPFSVWINGYTKKAYYPALLLSDSVLINENTCKFVATKISTLAEIYDEW